jgi:lipopolysaccharide biosynthesis glycosyltransferase
MNDVIKVFVGTCFRNLQAEIALEYSIRKNTKSKVEIVWMRDAPGNPQFHGWNKANWGTGFTPFRWIIPELCDFKGRAIYMDVDMVCLGDIKELWEMNIPEDKVLISLPGNYSVMLFDCEKFHEKIKFKTIPEWKERSCSPAFQGLYNDYVTQLESNNLVEALPQVWNSLDNFDSDTRLIHYTKKNTQPWCPYPDRHNYARHLKSACEELWFKTYTEAMELRYGLK